MEDPVFGPPRRVSVYDPRGSVVVEIVPVDVGAAALGRGRPLGAGGQGDWIETEGKLKNSRNLHIWMINKRMGTVLPF